MIPTILKHISSMQSPVRFVSLAWLMFNIVDVMSQLPSLDTVGEIQETVFKNLRNTKIGKSSKAGSKQVCPDYLKPRKGKDYLLFDVTCVVVPPSGGTLTGYLNCRHSPANSTEVVGIAIGTLTPNFAGFGSPSFLTDAVMMVWSGFFLDVAADQNPSYVIHYTAQGTVYPSAGDSIGTITGTAVYPYDPNYNDCGLSKFKTTIGANNPDGTGTLKVYLK